MSAVMEAASQSAKAWRMAPLSQVCLFKPPKSICRKQLADDADVSFVPMNDLGELVKYFEPKEVRTFGEVVKSYTYFADGDVLCAKITPCFENGKLGIARDLKNGVGFGSSEFVVMRTKDELLPEFLYYYLSQDAFREAGARVMSGAVGHKRVPKEYFESLRIPLPPLEEQKRIVAVLDQAFAALDRARAHAEANLAGAMALSDAALAAVFHDHPPSWKTRKLRELCDRITVGHVGPMAQRYVQSGIPFLRSQNIRPFEVSLEDVKFIDDSFHKELSKSELRPGDVAIVRTGYPGTAAVVPESLPISNCADLVIARPKSDISPHFLAMFLNSSFGKSMVAANAVGAAQKHFNVGSAKNVDFSFPPIEEQKRIVQRAERIRAHTGRLTSEFADKLSDIADLRQSLLQKAFAGQLS